MSNEAINKAREVLEQARAAQSQAAIAVERAVAAYEQTLIAARRDNPDNAPNRNEIKAPTSILTLAREIRQNILHYTFEHLHELDLRWNFHHHAAYCGGKVPEPMEMRNWFQILVCVHPTIAKDVLFIGSQWVAKYQTGWLPYCEREQERETAAYWISTGLRDHSKRRCNVLACHFCLNSGVIDEFEALIKRSGGGNAS